MRRLMLLITAMSLLAGPAMAVQQCQSAADQAAYEVLSLRELMTVLVIKCNRESDYNINFIKRFQPALQDNEREVSAYFRRVYGNAGQGRKDTFTTELVNVISQNANNQGTEFCSRGAWVLSEMNALRTMDELTAFAAVKDVTPVGMSMCPAPAAVRRR